MKEYYERLVENSQQRKGGSLCPYGYVILSYIGVAFILVGIDVFLTLNQESIGQWNQLYHIPYYIFLYLRIQRLNQFIIRKKEWYQDLLQLTKIHNPQLVQKVNALYPISIPAFLTVVMMALTIATIVVIFQDRILEFYLLEYVVLMILLFIAHLIIYQIKLNNSWNNIQEIEYEITSEINKEPWIEYPIVFVIDPKKKRNFLLWSIYSIFSFGIMGIVWDYRLHTDPDNMYTRFYQNEDLILETISHHLDQI
ncbi:MAG: hypothetical protein ACRC0X_10065 [Brevinema sp.]